MENESPEQSNGSTQCTLPEPRICRGPASKIVPDPRNDPTSTITQPSESEKVMRDNSAASSLRVHPGTRADLSRYSSSPCITTARLSPSTMAYVTGGANYFGMVTLEGVRSF